MKVDVEDALIDKCVKDMNLLSSDSSAANEHERGALEIILQQAEKRKEALEDAFSNPPKKSKTVANATMCSNCKQWGLSRCDYVTKHNLKTCPFKKYTPAYNDINKMKSESAVQWKIYAQSRDDYASYERENTVQIQ
jgi:hypothetical protein